MGAVVGLGPSPEISPLEYRYFREDGALSTKVAKYLSQSALLRYQLLVELAVVEELHEIGLCPHKVVLEVKRAASRVSTTRLRAVEASTEHDVGALVLSLKRAVSQEAAHYVHLFLASSDVRDTAVAMALRDFTVRVIIPDLRALVRTLLRLARGHMHLPQIGRTHGQHAIPITVGLGLVTYVDRLGRRGKAMERCAIDLAGKISGPVGSFGGMDLVVSDPAGFEKRVLTKLGLKRPLCSTQIVAPESVADLTYYVVSCFSVIADLCDDLRHLARPEIAEIRLHQASPLVVGSSCMPHKRNPIRMERVKSLWKAFMPRFITLFMDQLSEHQRDLTNSASSRFVPEIYAAFAYSLRETDRALRALTYDRNSLAKNLAMSEDESIAYPLSVCLAQTGLPDARTYVAALIHRAQKQGRRLTDLLDEDELARRAIRNSPEMRRILGAPSSYVGHSAKIVRSVCSRWRTWAYVHARAQAT